MGQVQASSKTLVDNLVSNTKKTLDFSSALQHVLLTSKNLGKEFRTIDDIQEKMENSSRFYKKIESEISNIVSTGIMEMKQKTLKELDAANASQEERAAALAKVEDLERQINNDVMENLVLTKKRLDQNHKVELSMQNVKDIVDKLAVQIRKPDVAANNVLKKMGGWAPALLKANQEGKSLVDMTKDLGVKLFDAGKARIKIIWSCWFIDWWCSSSYSRNYYSV